MLLNEIIDTKQYKRKAPGHNFGNGRTVIPTRFSDPVGTGYFSYVKNKRNDPHMVQKVNKNNVDPKHDGYNLYVKTIVDKNLADQNPYFPRVYRINSFVKNKQSAKITYEMERLTPLSQLEYPMQRAILRRITGSKDDKPNHIVNGIVDLVYNVIQGNVKCADKALNQAGRTIKRLADKHWLELDIKAENLMARLGPYGAQLVITDPVFDG